MAMGDQDIFDSEVPEAPTTTEGVSPEAPVRDEQGRFAARDKGEEPADAPEAAPPAAAEKSQTVPLQALKDERDRRQAAEAQIAQYRAAHQQQAAPLPDPVEDAAGYTRHIQQQFEQARQADRLQMSQFLAEEKFGPDAVAEAMAYFDGQPYAVSAQFLRERSPFHAAVAWYQRHKLAEERMAPDYEDKLRAKWEAEQRAKQPEPVQSPARIPRSLAEASGSGREPPDTSNGDPLFS